jgi:hypothetical protein
MRAIQQSPTQVKDTPGGRALIAAEIARLRDWCQRTETPWLPGWTRAD